MSMRLMEQHLCNLKLYTKELNTQSRKCNREEAKEKSKCKKAIQNGTMEKAQIHGENAIRQKNQGLNFLHMSARVDAVASRIQSMIANRKVMCSIGGVCQAIEQAMRTLNMTSIATCLDQFEKQFESLDVQSSFTEQAMDQTTTTTVPINEVNNLLQSVADEAGLELRLDLPRTGHGPIANVTKSDASSSTTADQDDELSARLAKLRFK